MSRIRLAIVMLALAASACTNGDRRLETTHQPVVNGNVASVPGCPDWSDSGKPPSEGQSSNFGCATNTNLAAMIADPADLLRGRTDTLGGAEQTVKAIRGWNTMEPTSKSWTVTTSISPGGGGK